MTEQARITALKAAIEYAIVVLLEGNSIQIVAQRLYEALRADREKEKEEG